MPLSTEQIRAVQRALETADSTEVVSPPVEAVLLSAMNTIWIAITAAPETYTMDNLEFKVFNRYRNSDPRYENPTAQRAVQRYWNARTDVGQVDGGELRS